MSSVKKKRAKLSSLLEHQDRINGGSSSRKANCECALTTTAALESMGLLEEQTEADGFTVQKSVF